MTMGKSGLAGLVTSPPPARAGSPALLPLRLATLAVIAVFTLAATASVDAELEPSCPAFREHRCHASPILEEVIPASYHKSEAPVSKNGGPVKVYVSFQVMDIDDISEESMAFRLHMFVVDLWKDDRLNLTRFLQDSGPKSSSPTPETLREGARRGRHDPRVLPEEVRDAVWKPDLIFVNSKNGYLFEHSVPNTFLKVLNTGHIYRSSRYLFQVDCLMELQKYPMDTQNCYLKVGLMSTPEDLATLHWMDDESSPQRNFSTAIRLLEDIKPLQFFLDVPVTHSATEAWMFENYTYLYANFTFVRRLTASIVNTYIPSGLVVALSWLTFWLDVSAVPARITLGVTSILTLATQVVQSRSSLPPVDYIKAVDVWLFVCLVMVFASLLEYAVAYNLEKILAMERKRKPEPQRTAIHVTPSSRVTPSAWQRDNVGPTQNSINHVPATPVANDVANAGSALLASVSEGNYPTLATPSVVSLNVTNSVPRSVNSVTVIQPATNNNARTVKTGRRRLFQRSFTLGQLWQKTNVLDKVSRIGFPAVFFLFMLVYWSYYLR
ncbi:glycine receptor subunit alpha-1 [Ixodes scapularis]|nr:glycine receptor subunit alpha-1 [Ixodes scapularis]